MNMSGGEVEPWIWKAAMRATERYFRGVMARCLPIERLNYRTGYIMGYRAGKRRTVNKSPP